jgi:hypothetical protein
LSESPKKGNGPAKEAGYKETLVYLESMPSPPPLMNEKSLMPYILKLKFILFLLKKLNAPGL